MEVPFALGGQLLLLAKAAPTAAEARGMLERSITSGAALAKFRDMISAQGGDPRVTDDASLSPRQNGGSR